MKFSKIKNVFILALLLVNAALLLLVIPQAREARSTSRATGEDLERLFAGRGVTLDPETLPTELVLYELELTGGLEAEQNAVSLLLGPSVLLGDDAGLVSNQYAGELGNAEFHKSGAFSITLTQSQPVETELIQAAEVTLGGLGFVPFGEPELERVSGGRYTVTAVQSLEGAKVYGSQAVLQYDNNCLTSVTGVWYGNYTGEKGDVPCVSAAAALVSFLASQDDLGWVCTTIEQVSQGYIEQQTPSLGASLLTPVWLVETDTGAFFVNGITKDVTAAAGAA